MKSVYSAVRTGSLNNAVFASYLKGLHITKLFTYMFLIPLQDDGLLRRTFYAQHPVTHGTLHNFLSLYFKIIFIITF